MAILPMDAACCSAGRSFWPRFVVEGLSRGEGALVRLVESSALSWVIPRTVASDGVCRILSHLGQSGHDLSDMSTDRSPGSSPTVVRGCAEDLYKVQIKPR